MTLSSRIFSSIALAKEIESPENPGALEKRVALVPADIGRLTQAGIKVYVEYGAGEGVGFSDAEYEQNNAIMQPSEQLYRDKELIIKFKGPSLSSIEEMREGCTLFCMAHFHSYPDRAKLLQDRRINVIAMEEICESPKVNSDQDILGRLAMAEAFDSPWPGGARVDGGQPAAVACWRNGERGSPSELGSCRDGGAVRG